MAPTLLACAALAQCLPARALADEPGRALPRSVSGQAGTGLDSRGLFALRIGVDAQPLAVGSAFLLGARFAAGDSLGWSGATHTFVAAAPSITFTDFGRSAPLLAFAIGPAYVEERTQTSLLGNDPVRKQTSFGLVASGSVGMVFRTGHVGFGPQLVFEGGSIPFTATLQFAVGLTDGP